MRQDWQSHLYVRWIFLRILSLCFLAAFASAAVQMPGLYGPSGIEPVENFLKDIYQHLGPEAYLTFPSIFWHNSSAEFMQAVCIFAAFVSALAFFGFLSGPCFFLLWMAYLSIVSVGQDFMSFQWDTLLLETGLLAIFFAPWRLREPSPFPDRKRFEMQAEPSFLFLFLLRMLCFKLMLLSGLCKLASHDIDGSNSWRDLSAMTFHYLSQPLPTPLAWLIDKMPAFLQRASTIIVFLVELALPLSLLSFWRPARIAACCGFIALMIIIMLTGNYAFFNWLTIALSITLLDDRAIYAFLPRSLKLNHKFAARRLSSVLTGTLLSLPAAILIGSASIGMLWVALSMYARIPPAPDSLKVAAALGQYLRSFNSYGLFANMTKGRLEIIIEGSNDGESWKSYEFAFKPGDIYRAPPLVAPHQPRLDWQMWFAALGSAADSPWFDSLMKRLLEGSPSILALFKHNPFPDGPPKYIRARVYDYKFSTFSQLLSKSQWWSREEKGSYYPQSSLSDFLSP